MHEISRPLMTSPPGKSQFIFFRYQYFGMAIVAIFKHENYELNKVNIKIKIVVAEFSSVVTTL